MATCPPAAEPRQITVGPLRIEVASAEDACVVRIEGELDMYSSPNLREEIDGLLAGDVPVVLDMEQLTFVDSSGIRCLVLVASRARTTGNPLRMLPPANGQVSQVLALTRVDKYLPLADR
ncbi:MAG TPA: STAS domain-containing protein [Solirubrobacterales bacterium]|nr:STAS domain-containing protein [Solirubrobacterales bacterium]